MRAVRCHELSGPSGLRVDEVPDPAQPGAGEVLIGVRAAGVNFPDVLITQGKYQFKPDPPFVPGGEIAGRVEAVGPGVTSVKVGDRVAATMLFGAFAERVLVPEAAVAKIGDAVSFEIGAAVLLTYATTMHALIDRANLQKGEKLLVLGAAGGVGIAAVEVGKCLGAHVIAAASSREKLDFCVEHGADAVIDYTKENLKDRAKALSGGGLDVVYDPVGGDYTEAALRAMAWGGRLLVVGFASGPIPKIPTNLVLLKSCQIVGVFWGQFAMREPEKNRAHVEQVLRWIEEGRIRPHLDSVLTFDMLWAVFGGVFVFESLAYLALMRRLSVLATVALFLTFIAYAPLTEAAMKLLSLCNTYSFYDANAWLQKPESADAPLNSAPVRSWRWVSSSCDLSAVVRAAISFRACLTTAENCGRVDASLRWRSISIRAPSVTSPAFTPVMSAMKNY